MEIEEIRSNLPSIISILEPQISNPDQWKQVQQDLSDLQWFSTTASAESVIFGLISISDRSGLILLSGSEPINIFSLSRAKLFINDTIYKVVSNKLKIKEICTSSKNLINEMVFFKTCLQLITDSPDDQVEEKVQYVERTYKKFKENFVDLTRQLEKSIQHEFDKSFSEVIDEVLFSAVLKPIKDRVQSLEVLSLIRSYKKERYYSTNYNYFSSSSKYEDIYVGEMKSGLKHGYGKMYYSFRDMYDGYWKDDKKHGKGLYVWKSGNKYFGEFENGKIHGQGVRTSVTGEYYKGRFQKGKRWGAGFMRFKCGDTYDGTWEDDDMHGQGVYVWKSGDRFEGEFKKDKRDGKGILTLSTGEVIEGTWEEGVQKAKECQNP